MPYASPSPERTLRSRVTNKIKAAERREAEAERLRAEAAELQKRWERHVASGRPHTRQRSA